MASEHHHHHGHHHHHHHDHSTFKTSGGTLDRVPALIDYDFEGYRFTGVDLANARLDLPTQAFFATPSHEFSFAHVKSNSTINRLVADPTTPSRVFYVDTESRICFVDLFENGAELGFGQVTVVSVLGCGQQRPTVDPVIVFASDHTIAFSDGRGELFIFQRDDNEVDPWRVLFRTSECYGGAPCPFTIRAAQRDGHVIRLILQHVTDPAASTPAVVRIAYVEVHVGDIPQLGNVRVYEGKSVPEFVSIEHHGEGFYLLADVAFARIGHVTPPSELPVELAQPEPQEDAPPAFVWQQTEDDVEVTLPISATLAANDVSWVLSASHVTLSVRSTGETLLTGKLGGLVHPDESVWTIDTNTKLISITFVKASVSQWVEVVDTQKDIAETLSLETIRQIRERWQHLTSDKLADNSTRTPLVSRAPDHPLEECDFVSAETSTLYRIDTKHGDMTSTYRLTGQEYLMSLTLKDNPYDRHVCIQDDVHALVFKLSREHKPKHILTFPAFGYVQASKPDRKFLLASDDAGLAVIVECLTNVLLYAKTGASALYRIGLESPVIGAVLAGHYVYVLTQATIIAINTTGLLNDE